MQAHCISALALVEATVVTPSVQASLAWKAWFMVTHSPFLWPAEACCSLREWSRSGPVFQVPHQGDWLAAATTAHGVP